MFKIHQAFLLLFIISVYICQGELKDSILGKKPSLARNKLLDTTNLISESQSSDIKSCEICKGKFNHF